MVQESLQLSPPRCPVPTGPRGALRGRGLCPERDANHRPGRGLGEHPAGTSPLPAKSAGYGQHQLRT